MQEEVNKCYSMLLSQLSYVEWLIYFELYHNQFAQYSEPVGRGGSKIMRYFAKFTKKLLCWSLYVIRLSFWNSFSF